MVLYGYAGKMLFVDLSTGSIQERPLEEKVARDFLGGYGLGAKILYGAQAGGADPLGPEAMFGVTTGPLVGVGVNYGVRHQIVGKSPLTGTWGDSSSGGDFARNLKRAGYDAVFITGISDKPVYLWVKDGVVEIRDAAHLWGLSTWDAEDRLKEELQEPGLSACTIGPAGEMQSLIACVITDKGNAAGRSGLGAVMGSKRLKAIVARGTQDVPVADLPLLRGLIKSVAQSSSSDPRAASMSKYGTSAGTARSILSGDCPIKNWGGSGPDEMPNAEQISDEGVIKYLVKYVTCTGCAAHCNGVVKVDDGPYAIAWAQKPEYETLGAFGAMLLNDNMESIITLNAICDRYGIDTISAGGTIAWAIESYENGMLTQRDTDGLELTWGNHQAIVALMDKMARREGFGAILADGSQRAAERIGRGSELYAIHIHGQEPPMHDPKMDVVRENPWGRRYGLALAYQTDAAPARHTGPQSINLEQKASSASGLCSMGGGAYREGRFCEALRRDRRAVHDRGTGAHRQPHRLHPPGVQPARGSLAVRLCDAGSHEREPAVGEGPAGRSQS
jgi:aldehyde:ferredoxin oxidoreductase